MKRIKYVCGFCFDHDGKHVLLIQKDHPEWQRDLLNGVGGKIEESDGSPEAAMIREFKEEVGLEVTHWHRTVTLWGDGWAVVFLKAHVDLKVLQAARAMTSELPQLVFVADLWTIPVIPNLRWLIPLQLDNLMFPIIIEDMGGIEQPKVHHQLTQP